MIAFLLKGLVRDRTRSLFPILMVSAGAFLTVFLYSYMNGAINDMVDTGARFDAGHTKITTRAYGRLSDQIPNDLAMLGVSDLMARLKKDRPGWIWAPRIKFGGLLDIPGTEGQTRAQGPVFGMGIDLNGEEGFETRLLNLKKSIVEGTMPDQENEILISEPFAQKLNVDIGETATLITTTMHGSMSITNWKISGTVRFGMVTIDRQTIVADLDDIRAALDMDDAAGEIVGFTSDLVYDDSLSIETARRFNRETADPNDDFSPVMTTLGEEETLGVILRMTRYVGAIVVGVFVFAMSIVLWNAGLMNGIRRYGEIGVRLAVGESKGALYRSMIIESVCVGIAGSILGTLFGLIASYWLQYAGFDISAMMQKSTVLFSNIIRARVTPTSYVIGFVPGLFASVLGTLFAGIGIYRRQTSQLFRELET